MISFIDPRFMRKGNLTMRERTTWNRDQITAAMSRTADPYAMNQDHLQQQPKADKYLTGDPSTFAEDVTAPNTWDREYAGGTTERDEIGLPAFRGETFNHAEKTAGMSEKDLLKKADICTTVARLILKGRKYATEKAATDAVEQQSVSLMYLPNVDLINMASRLAAEEQFPGGQFPEQQQAAQEGQQQGQGQSQQQQALQQAEAAYQQATQQCVQAMQKGDATGVQSALQVAVQKAAHLNTVRKAADEAQQQAQGQQQGQQAAQEGEQGQQGQGQQQQATMDQQALETMLAQAVQAADYDAKKGPGITEPGYGPYNGPQAGGAKSARTAEDQQQVQQGQGQQQAQQQVQQDPAQQQVQQAQQQVQPQGQGQQQQQAVCQQTADDQILDDMLMGPQAGQGTSEVDIEMEPASMDVGDVVLSSTDDEVLKTLFANEETEEAEQAQGQQKQGMTRTASTNQSTRTLGTRPTGGVAKVGGGPAPRKGGDVDSLTALWPSAPDVREAFGIR